MKINHYQILLFTIFLSVSLLTMSGCNDIIEVRHTVSSEVRYVEIEYKFLIEISTEPQGAKVYIQDDYMGNSPLYAYLVADKVKIKQIGDYPVSYKYNTLWEYNLKNYTRTGETVWKPHAAGGSFDGGWTVKIYKDGYQPFEYRITQQSLKRFDETVDGIDFLPEGKKLGKYFLRSEDSENFLFDLKPAVSFISPPSYQQSAPEQTKALTEAQQEYESALSAYNQAIKKLNNARVWGNVNQMSSRNLLNSNDKTDRAAGLINTLSSSASINDAEREVDITRERLERAKARLNNLELK